MRRGRGGGREGKGGIHHSQSQPLNSACEGEVDGDVTQCVSSSRHASSRHGRRGADRARAVL